MSESKSRYTSIVNCTFPPVNYHLPMRPISARIKRLRKDLGGVTLETFGKWCGVSKAAVQQWEAEDGTTPSWEALLTLQRKKRVNPKWVLHGGPDSDIFRPLDAEELNPRQRAILDLFDGLTETQQEKFFRELQDAQQRNEEIFLALSRKRKEGQ